MPTAPCHALPRSTRRRLGATISALMLVAGCTAPTPTPPSIPGGPEPAPRPPQTGVTAPEPGAPALAPRPVQAPPSLARTPREFRRDAAAHPSPNAGVVEAAFAGSLGIRLGGTNRYYDVIYASSSQDVDIYGNIVKNATDEEAITDTYLTDDSSGLYRNAFFSEPRTYGMAVTKRW